jgi:hypothetical protein
MTARDELAGELVRHFPTPVGFGFYHCTCLDTVKVRNRWAWARHVAAALRETKSAPTIETVTYRGKA